MMGVDVLFRRAPTPSELDQIEKQVKACTKCRLHEERTQAVFACGDPNATLMFVGEGPGADEDATGVPFVGRAGKLLDKMIFAMGLRRDDVYITNIVKCRPPGNRDPRPDEVETCWPYLERQIELVRPQMICTLGRPATNALLSNTQPMSALRGRWHEFRGIPLLPTYHPAYLLRSPGQKARAWEDLKMLIAALRDGPPATADLF